MSTPEDKARAEGGITRYLRTGPGFVFNLYAIFAAFTTYFCMYAFRKPFAAASYEGFGVLDGALTAKAAFVLSQLVGDTLSKYIGIKIGSEVAPAHRLRGNLGLIAAAQLALVGWLIVIAE